MRQGRTGQRKTKSGNRRGAVVAPSPPPPAAPPPTANSNHHSPLQSGGGVGGGCTNHPPTNNLEDPSGASGPTTWKGAGDPQQPPPGSQQPFGGGGPGFPGGPGGGPGPGGPSPFSGGPPVGAVGSPGGPYGPGGPGGPPPGSTTPGYTASPAPSGSSTPGPIGGPGGQFPPPPSNQSYNTNGPPNGPPHSQQSFGSPGPAGFGRPGSSGPPGPPFGPGGMPPQHYQHQRQQQQQQFVGDPTAFGMPPGSPFGPVPGGHHPGMGGGPMGPHPGMVGPGGPMVGPGGPGGPMVGPGPGMDRMDQGSLAVPRRHTPYFGQPDYRIYELNKRLQQRTEQPLQESDNLWWDAFATEFFEDDASLTLAFCLDDGPKRYTIGRTLIPRYFRSIFEGGVTELYYNLKHPKESFHNTSITLDCDQCTMITHHGKPLFTKVCTDGRLILEFTFDDLMRIKSWHFAVRAHRELIPRSVVSIHANPDPGMLDQLSKNITRQGITNSTLNYLRLCVILEPMQELMSRHKAYALSPRDCLKTTLFQKWQRMVAPPEAQRPASKRRKRKGSNSGGAANNTPPVASKKRSPGPNFSLASQDVMVVGEPSLMGGEFGDEDERLITRLENTQYDAANSLDQHPHHHPGGHGHMGVVGGPPPPHMQQGPHGGVVDGFGGGGGADSPMGPGGPGWGSAAASAAAAAAMAAAAAAAGGGGPGED